MMLPIKFNIFKFENRVNALYHHQSKKAYGLLHLLIFVATESKESLKPQLLKL